MGGWVGPNIILYYIAKGGGLLEKKNNIIFGRRQAAENFWCFPDKSVDFHKNFAIQNIESQKKSPAAPGKGFISSK